MTTWQRLGPLAFGLAFVTLLGAVIRMGLAFRDLRSLAEARTQAATDDLTALPNRRLFMRHARDAIAAAGITGDGVSVLMLDLDNFKQLNDTLGHDAGDTLLRLIGPRVRQAIRGTDTLARLGGDEFAVLLYPHPGEAGIGRVADKMLGALREPFEVQGLALRITASVGIASFPQARGRRRADEARRHRDVPGQGIAERIRVLRQRAGHQLPGPAQSRRASSPPRSSTTASSSISSRRPMPNRAGSRASKRSCACACRMAGSFRRSNFSSPPSRRDSRGHSRARSPASPLTS